MKTKPITPQQIRQERLEAIPDAVIRAVNCLLSNHMESYCGTHGIARLRQSDIVTAILDELRGDGMFDSCMPSEAQMVERGWLNLKPIFASAGWCVSRFRGEDGERMHVFQSQFNVRG